MKIVTTVTWIAICFITGSDSFTLDFQQSFEQMTDDFIPRVDDTDISGGPARQTLHPDDIKIAICSQSMSECPWTADELASKIVERQNVDIEQEFSGEGISVGPPVDPSDVGDKLTEEPPTGKEDLRAKGERRRSGVPKVCLPFGRKSRRSRSYIINCLGYLKDRTIRKFARRRNAMVACFKCRYLCELGGEVTYL